MICAIPLPENLLPGQPFSLPSLPCQVVRYPRACEYALLKGEGRRGKTSPASPQAAGLDRRSTPPSQPGNPPERHDMGPPKGAVAYAGPPDPERGIYYPIISPKPNHDVFGVILCETILGVYTHWFDKQTRPCLGSREACAPCDLRYERRWKGYLGCWNTNNGRLF